MRVSSVAMRLTTLALSALFIAQLCAPADAQSTKGSGFLKKQKVFGYYPRYNAEFQSPQQLKYELYTDVLFFVTIPQLDLSFTYGDDSVGIAEKQARDFVAEAHKHHVQALVSVGGWTGSIHFSTLLNNPERLKAFARALVNYSRKFGFDGIDLDWEYPNQDGVGCNSKSPQDTVNLGKFLKELRSLWPNAQLTAAISINGLMGASGDVATPAETALVVTYLDFVHLMAYDFYGAWTTTTGPHSALSSRCAPTPSVSVETGLKVLIEQQKFLPQQISLGIPAYAHSWELKSDKLAPSIAKGRPSFYYQETTGVHIRGGKTDDAPAKNVCGVQEDWGGVWLVNELISKGWLSPDQTQGKGGFVRHWDECSSTPFLTNGKIFFSYDDQFSSVKKAKYAVEHHLAGVSFFDTLGPTESTIRATRAVL